MTSRLKIFIAFCDCEYCDHCCKHTRLRIADRWRPVRVDPGFDDVVICCVAPSETEHRTLWAWPDRGGSIAVTDDVIKFRSHDEHPVLQNFRFTSVSIRRFSVAVPSTDHFRVLSPFLRLTRRVDPTLFSSVFWLESSELPRDL